MNTETPHPLAVEAAENIISAVERGNEKEYSPHMRPIVLQVVAESIHTTALELVLKAGEDLADCVGCGCGGDYGLCNRCAGALCVWRTLTSPKTGDSTPDQNL